MDLRSGGAILDGEVAGEQAGEQVRRLAVRVAALADEVRASGVRVAAASGVRWRSVAATAFRSRLADQATAARLSAVGVEDVAEALHRHARSLDAAALRPGGR
jgi:hypothetical protein